jgi:chromate transporter
MSPSPPSLLTLFRTWLTIGATSFGGGSATQLLIQQHFVERLRWLTPAEFAQDWAVVQFAPGINLIAIAILIGRRIGGASGIALSMLGMLLPAVGITIAMTAIYTRVRDLPQIAGALRGITPALVGMSLAFTWRLLKPPMQSLRPQGRGPFAIGIVLIAATLAMTASGIPVLLSYLLGAAGLGLLYGLRRHRTSWTG